MEPGGGGGEGGGRRIRGADNKALLGMMQRPPPSPTNTSTSTSGSASVSSTSAGSGTTGGGSRTSSYLDFLIGDPVHRQAKAQLNRYRASLAAEAARAEAGAQRGWRALTAFETEARRDGEQLARTGGRHLALFEYICGLRASLLRLELAQWRSAARLLRAREGEVGRWLEGKGGVQALLAEAGGDRLDERVHLRPSPQELLAGNAELAALRRRAGLLAPVCEGVGAEASLLVLQGTGAGGGGGGGGGPGGGSAAAGQGCEGCGMGLEGPVEAVEERRRRLQLLAEEASVLYFGGASSAGHGAAAGGGSGGGDEEEKEEPSSRPALSPAEEGAAGNGSGPLGSLQRQREVLLRRLRCEREFAQLVADERQREGRLLARWLEVLRDVAGEEEDEDGGEDGGGREMEVRVARSECLVCWPFAIKPQSTRTFPQHPTPQPPQQSSHAARTHAHAHSRSLSGSHAAAAAGGGGGGLSSSISSSATGGGGLFPACDAPVHAPRCIAAFVKYLAKRVKDAYQVGKADRYTSCAHLYLCVPLGRHCPRHNNTNQLDDGLKSALVGLTQALVFRRARRVCFGYVKGARMRRLNRLWREKVNALEGSSVLVGVYDGSCRRSLPSIVNHRPTLQQ